MGIFDFLGLGGKSDRIKDFLEEGAIIIDVRSKAEYAGGHIELSKNIPLENIESQFEKWKKANQSVIFCCASGMRSGAATKKAKSHGVNALNGGGWSSLSRFVSVT